MGQSRSSLRHTSRSTHGASVELRLLDSFALRAGGDVVDLPSTGQRLVALVALHERPLTRDFAAGTLWPETPDTRAAGNLRSALWRVQKLAPGLLHVDPMTLRLEDTVDVDLHRLERLAHDQLTLTGSAPPDARDLAGDLLPGWYDDDWLLLERERLRQLRL